MYQLATLLTLVCSLYSVHQLDGMPVSARGTRRCMSHPVAIGTCGLASVFLVKSAQYDHGNRRLAKSAGAFLCAGACLWGIGNYQYPPSQNSARVMPAIVTHSAPNLPIGNNNSSESEELESKGKWDISQAKHVVYYKDYLYCIVEQNGSGYDDNNRYCGVRLSVQAGSQCIGEQLKNNPSYENHVLYDLNSSCRKYKTTWTPGGWVRWLDSGNIRCSIMQYCPLPLSVPKDMLVPFQSRSRMSSGELPIGAAISSSGKLIFILYPENDEKLGLEILSTDLTNKIEQDLEIEDIDGRKKYFLTVCGDSPVVVGWRRKHYTSVDIYIREVDNMVLKARIPHEPFFSDVFYRYNENGNSVTILGWLEERGRDSIKIATISSSAVSGNIEIVRDMDVNP